MTNPKISIVTPSYNQGRFIEDTIKSVKEQGFDDVEHIVIDGGSDDDTVSILKEYESEYDLRWISEPDDGQSDAINKGVEMADGRFIGWINADDYYLPGAFSTFHVSHCRHPEADVIYGDLLLVDIDGNEVGRQYHTLPSRFVHKYWQNYTANHCTFIKRKTFLELGGVREDLEYVMDIDLLWRLLNREYDFVHIASFIAAHRIHEATKTGGVECEALTSEKQWLRDSYPISSVEKVLPRRLLTVMAICFQIGLFARERRWAGIEYIVRRIQK